MYSVAPEYAVVVGKDGVVSDVGGAVPCSDDDVWWTGGGTASSIECHLSKIHHVRGSTNDKLKSN